MVATDRTATAQRAPIDLLQKTAPITGALYPLATGQRDPGRHGPG